MSGQRDVLEAEGREPQVVGVGISPVDRDLDELGLGELLSHHCRTVVTGTVVHHADLITETSSALVERSQAISQQVTGIVVDNDNEQV